MTTLYIDRKDLELRTSAGTLEFYEPSGRRGSVPLAHLDRVVVHGRAKLDTSVLGAITQAGAGILFLSGRKSERLAVCVGRPHNDVLRRLGQFDAFRDVETRQHWARELVQAKIGAQARLLRRAKEQRPEKSRALTRTITRLDGLLARITDTEDATLGTMLGFEGAAAAAYFEGFRVLFAPSLEFEKRRRRPPKDPVNACLSLGYTLLHSNAVIACHAAGLDPLLGLYHEPAFGRESLAADAMEPLRPHIDEWVWQMFRTRTLTRTLFRADKGAILLGKEGRQRFYEHFEPLGRSLRTLLRRQVGKAARQFEDRGRSIQPSSEAVVR